MNIILIQVGKTKQNFWQQAESEYIKRLKPYAKLQIVTLKEEKVRQDTPQERQKVMEKEGQKILDFVDSGKNSSAPPRSALIALDAAGKTFQSPQLAQKLEEIQKDNIATSRSQTLIFVIGGCYGLSQTVKARASLLLSLSPMTFTHEMARVILLEQLYRAFTITAAHPYHY